MLKNVTDLAAPDYSKGLNTILNVLAVGKNQTPNIMNVKVNFDGSIEKRAGSVTNNSVVIAQSGAASWIVDAGASLSTSLQSFWPLNEVGGNRISSFSSYILQDNNSTPSNTGIRNRAAEFVSLNSQYLSIVNTAALATGDVDFSMSAWFYLNSTGANTIIAKRDTPAPYGGADINTVLLLHCDGTEASQAFTDSSVYIKTVSSVSNALLRTNSFKFGTASAFFDGSGAHLTVPDSDDFFFGTSDLTVDTWAKFTNTAGTQVLFQAGENVSGGAVTLYTTPTQLVWGYYDANSATITNISALTWARSANTFYHVAAVRSSNLHFLLIDGNSLGAAVSNAVHFSNSTVGLQIGTQRYNSDILNHFDGNIDEFRLTKGVARFNNNFPVPVSSYSTGTEYEYWLFINTDNIVTFRISSSGRAEDVTVQANSFGAVSTSTWYNTVAWHDAGNNFAGISVNLATNSASYASGVRSGSSPFMVGAASGSTIQNLMNGRIDEIGFWKKVLSASERSDLYNSGSGNTYSNSFPSTPWASFDFGASGTRWLTCSAGTGIYASSDLGRNWTTIGTSQSATYQYHNRSKNVLIVTSDLYDPPVYWAGSGGSYVVRVNSNAPLAKYSVNFKGFSILMNTQARKRSFTYQDENTQLTGTWANSFDLPSSADDEITDSFILRRYLYVSTRYRLFRLSYVGGSPDWQYDQVRNFGFVPRTPKVFSVGQMGEVAVGESWDRRLRIFDGSDDKIISSDVEEDNKMCDFAMDKVSYAGSGLVTHFGEVDPTAYVYRLAVGIGQNSTNITHHINFDARTMSFYPYSNMPFTTMTVAESGGTRYLVAFDGSGYCHLMDSGNLDGGKTPVDDVFDSPFGFDKVPSAVSKAHKLDFFLSATSSGNLYFYDRADFNPDFKLKHTLVMDNTTKLLIKKPVDIPETYSVYQFRLSSSSGTADPWRLVRNDKFLAGMGVGG